MKMPQRKNHKSMTGEQMLSKAMGLKYNPKPSIKYKSGMQAQDEKESEYKDSLNKSGGLAADDENEEGEEEGERNELISEHERLVGVLRSGNKLALAAEAKIQERELRKLKANKN